MSKTPRKRFSAQNLWRMRQFYETYRDDPKLSPLLRELRFIQQKRALHATDAPKGPQQTSPGQRPGKRDLKQPQAL